MLSQGDRVKDCEIIAPLGSGGMAALYLARRRGVGGFSRLVTLKLVHPHLVGDEHVVQMFLDEARLSAHIAHPNVVHVEEVGEYDGSYFIAMEYVHGVTLAELLARLGERHMRLRRKLCVWLAAQIAEALHAAHEARGEQGAPLDIVHRDVSPQNVLIGHTGHIKLIDFGIAKSQAECEHRTYGRPVLGKLRYMSPEQLRLEPADRRVDVYALGVMLWEMLTGRNLLRCQQFDDERDWAMRESPTPPSRYAGHCPPALDRVVLKALAYDAGERYESALDFRRALLRVDPEAAQVDAPIVASLMRALFGAELNQRRAAWPSEVVAELDARTGVTESRTWGIGELTDTLAPCRPERLRPMDGHRYGTARVASADEPIAFDLDPEEEEDVDTITRRLPRFVRVRVRLFGVLERARAGLVTARPRIEGLCRRASVKLAELGRLAVVAFWAIRLAVWRLQLPSRLSPGSISLAIPLCFATSFVVCTLLVQGTPCEHAARAQHPQPLAASVEPPEVVPAAPPAPRSPPPEAPSVLPERGSDPERDACPRVQPEALAVQSPTDAPEAVAASRVLTEPGDRDSEPVPRRPAAGKRRSLYGSSHGSARSALQLGRPAAASGSKQSWRRRWQPRFGTRPHDWHQWSELRR